MAMTKRKKRIKRIDKCLDTIKAIISNQNLKKYLVGLTLLPAGKKSDAYRGWGFDHAVVLESHLSADDAKKLEGDIQKRCWKDKRRMHWKKYHPEKRDKGAAWLDKVEKMALRASERK